LVNETFKGKAVREYRKARTRDSSNLKASDESSFRSIIRWGTAEEPEGIYLDFPKLSKAIKTGHSAENHKRKLLKTKS